MVADAEDPQPTPTPAGNSSQWTINWWGLVAIVIIASISLVTWRWLGGSSSESAGQLSVGTTTQPALAETTVPRSTTTTVDPTPPTTEPATTTTLLAERRVLISGEMKPCRYGANCLVASFTIAGFDVHPDHFTCIYPNSQRDFSFNNDVVDEACLTADEGDTITIEVDGLRSATISEQNLDGA